MRVFVLGACLLAARPASGYLATFDEFQKGYVGTAFMSGGIQFSHGTWFPNGVHVPFAIDNASSTIPALGFAAHYSAPNVMTVGGFVTGGIAPFIRVHSWQAGIPGQRFTSGRLDLFYIDDFPGTSVGLQAVSGMTVVASDNFIITQSNPGTALHRELRIDAPGGYDRLVFVVTGGPPGEENGILAMFDNVEMAPAPGALPLVLAGLLLASRRRRHSPITDH